MHTHRDLVYAHAIDRPLLLDLYLPASTSGPRPIIAWVHGDADDTVILNQSQYLYRALRVAGIEAAFHIVEGAGHGFRGASQAQLDEIEALVDAFFETHLRPHPRLGE